MAKGSILDFLFSSRNALAICVLLYLAVSLNTFLSSYYPGGVDVSTHLFQIGLIADEGFTPWNHWWYAGHPLLDQYPPLSHLPAALISNLVGVENAYKIIFFLVFVFLPVSFYLLLQELNLTEWQKSFALYFFALSPVYAYHLQSGVLSAMFALPFAILFLKCLIQALGRDEWLRPAAVSALFLAIAALAHLFTPVAAALIGFIYLVSFKRSIQSIKRFASIGILAFCLVAFFWLPLALNYSFEDADKASLSLGSMVELALAPFGRAFAVYINYFSILTAAAIGLLTAAAAVFYWNGIGKGKQKDGDKPAEHLLFFALCVASVIIGALLPHGGRLIPFIPVFFSLFLCRYSDANKFSKALSVFVPALMLVLVLLVRNSYVPPETYFLAEWAANHTESRALFIPQGLGLLEPFDSKANSDTFLYEVYLLPHYFGKEVYNGWFMEAEPRGEIREISIGCGDSVGILGRASEIGPFSRTILGKLSRSCSWGFSTAEFCTILREGSVDSLFVNSNFPSVVEFADGAPCLERSGSYGPLAGYKVKGTEPYVDGNLPYSKESGRIAIHFQGDFHGNLTVRESHYPYWKAYLDSNEVGIEKSGHGFLSIPLQAGAGSHTLELVYSPNRLSGIPALLSIASWALLLLFLIKPASLGAFPSRVQKFA